MYKLGKNPGLAIAVLPVVAAAGYALASGAGDLPLTAAMAVEAPQWIADFDMDTFGVFFGSLLAIVNPVAAIPLFLAFTTESTTAERNRFAVLTAIAVLIAAAVAAIFGRPLLGFFSLSVDALRIAGGIIVLLMGLQLLQSEMSELAPAGEADAGPELRRSKIVCPLAIPFLLGPGAITTIIIQCETISSASGGLTIAAAVSAIAALVFVTLVAAQPIARCLGNSGLTVAARIGGMIIAAIAIDMMITGIRNVFPGIA